MRPVKRAAAATTFATIVTFVAVASGDAPPDQYVTFGPQATEIQDIHTHLLWQRVVAQTPTDHFGALDSCQKNGQRLPTHRELLTLVDEDPHAEWDPDAGTSSLRYIDPNAFPATPQGFFWSMSPSANQTTSRSNKVVDFSSGATADLPLTATAYYRCVIGP